MIFCRGAQHSWSTNINFFDQCVTVVGAGKCVFEWIKIDHQQIDTLNLFLLHGIKVVIKIAPCQQAPMNFGMKCLHAPAHDFWKAGYVCYVNHIDASVTKCTRGAAG